MEYRNLGNSGLKVSLVGLGGNNFGSRVGEEESIAIIQRALELGISYIDTSNWYGQKGLSETYIGKAIKGNRSRVVIATKFGFPMGESPNEQGGSRHHIIEAVNGSLKRLDTDYIDLYQFHRPDPFTPLEETLDALNTLVKEGKVHYIGCCNFPAWQLSDAIYVSKINHLVPFVTTQPRYNLLERDIEQELVPCCQKHGVGIIPWAPLAGGFLSGKYKKDEKAPPGSRMTWGTYRAYYTQNNFEKLEKLTIFAQEHGHSLLELAIGWLISHSWITTAILGATKVEQVSSNVAASGWRISKEEMAAINQIAGNNPVETEFGDQVKKSG